MVFFFLTLPQIAEIPLFFFFALWGVVISPIVPSLSLFFFFFLFCALSVPVERDVFFQIIYGIPIWSPSSPFPFYFLSFPLPQMVIFFALVTFFTLSWGSIVARERFQSVPLFSFPHRTSTISFPPPPVLRSVSPPPLVIPPQQSASFSVAIWPFELLSQPFWPLPFSFPGTLSLSRQYPEAKILSLWKGLPPHHQATCRCASTVSEKSRLFFSCYRTSPPPLFGEDRLSTLCEVHPCASR